MITQYLHVPLFLLTVTLLAYYGPTMHYRVHQTEFEASRTVSNWERKNH